MEIDIYQEWSVPARRFAYGKFSVAVPFILEVPIKKKLPIRHWLSNHGFEWVQSYMKRLKTWAIRLLNMEKSFSYPWIKKRVYRSFIIPDYEVFYRLVDNILSDNLKVVKNIIAYLNSYKIQAPTRANGFDSIVKTPKRVLSNKLLEWYLAGANLPRVPLRALEPCEFIMGSRSWTMPDGSTRRGPIAKHDDHQFVSESFGVQLPASSPLNVETRADSKIIWTRDMDYDVQDDEYVIPPPQVSRVISGWRHDQTGVKEYYCWPCDQPISEYWQRNKEVAQVKHLKSLGKLSIVPSQGKARVILIGDYRAQLKCKNLADFLRKYLWSLPEVASGDQSKFERKVVNWLQNGYYVSSIDLSDFTDRLSLDAQIKVLSSMGVANHWFNFLKYEFWYRPKDFKFADRGSLERAKYSNGQPMGLFISFPMAELLHYLVIRFCSLGYGSEFVICGDDICVANKSQKDLKRTVARYKVHIERLGCTINEGKSLCGDVAEGVGKLYVRRGKNVTTMNIPSGSLSPAECELNPVLRKAIQSRSSLGRSIYYSLYLEPTMLKTFDERDIHAFYEWLILSDYSKIDKNVLRRVSQSLVLSEPTSWFPLDDAPKGVIKRSLLQNTNLRKRKLIRLPKVSVQRLNAALTTTYIKRLYKKERLATHGTKISPKEGVSRDGGPKQ